jgi:hypothetical protein
MIDHLKYKKERVSFTKGITALIIVGQNIQWILVINWSNNLYGANPGEQK